MSANTFNNVSTFKVDGVLFDMDGTLTDSIAAVEAAWTAKANELGLDPVAVIKATHGRRASDNLQELIPELKLEHVAQEVDRFERSILAFADTPPQSRRNSAVSSRKPSFNSQRSSGTATTTSMSSIMPMTPNDSPGASRRSSAVVFDITKVFTGLSAHDGEPLTNSPIEDSHSDDNAKFIKGDIADGKANDDVFDDDDEDEEEEIIDMSVQILPGVRNLINSLPKGKYAVATSGAKTYCHGCLHRTQITIPKVCVTADDPRLLRGKPFPDPFLLAANDLGIDPKRSVIFEDSPSGIKAAVAAGGTVIAVCTSHNREHISDLGAHFVIDTMDQVKVTQAEDGQLEFQVVH